VSISNVYLQEDNSFKVSREQNLVVEKGREVRGDTMTSIKRPASSFNDIEKIMIPREYSVSQRLSIRINEREIEDFEIKDQEELERIRRAMEKAKRVGLERGTLKEIAEGLYLGLDAKGNLLVVVL